jgi:hypothetical protein
MNTIMPESRSLTKIAIFVFLVQALIWPRHHMRKTPDLEKPFFVAQMGWRLADASKQREELSRKRAIEAEARVKQLESEKDKAWKTREKRKQEQEAARLRNLQDPKHLRKRLKQAKKRRKKKKK